MSSLKHTGIRALVGSAIAALAIMAGVFSAPGAASAAEGSQTDSAETSTSLIEGPLIDLGDLMNLIGSINIGQFQ